MSETTVKITEEQAREWEKKLFQKELVRAGKSLKKAEITLSNAKARMKYWEDKCRTK